VFHDCNDMCGMVVMIMQLSVMNYRRDARNRVKLV
jgi:hypothetical protein